MTTTLYIDGLLGSVCDQELKDMFSRFGNVRSVDIMRLNTVPSLGVGTVQMESLEEAKEAVHALHRSYLGGQLLLVFHAPIMAAGLERVFLRSTCLS